MTNMITVGVGEDLEQPALFHTVSGEWEMVEPLQNEFGDLLER